jgi:hypothetical protein
LVFPSFRNLALLKKLLNLLLLVLAEKLESAEALPDGPPLSMSKILTCESPAAVITVLSFECGMNLTEKMFCV